MIPEKLREGDEIRVVAPARNMAMLGQDTIDIAKANLEAMGLKISFGEHVMEKDDFVSSSIKSRVSDLEEAFGDKDIKGILTVIGGFNSNQLLRYIDYDKIKSNPKVFCGYSDVTILNNAFYSFAGLVNYSGPHFSTFGMKKGLEYTIEYFKKCLFEEKPFAVEQSNEWSDDAWFLDQERREFIKNSGYKVLSGGEAVGEIVGGNLCTLNLLQGTEFMPELSGKILFVEDDSGTKQDTFDRDLQSLLQQEGGDELAGVIIGRFQKKSEMKPELLDKIIRTKEELEGVPVIADASFGHTEPKITFPIGGSAELSALEGTVRLKIVKH